MEHDPTNGLLAVPGYLEAVSRERLVRDVSFLPVTESIGSFEVLPMTLRHFVMLRTINSPLLSHDVPNEKELSDFLWILSPDWKQDAAERDRWMTKCKCFVPPPVPRLRFPWLMRRWEKKVTDSSTLMADLTEEAWIYVSEALQDKPRGSRINGFSAEYYSDACALVDQMIASDYPWSEQEILSMPLKRIFQYLKRIQQRTPRSAPLENPSDKITMQWYSRINVPEQRN